MSDIAVSVEEDTVAVVTVTVPQINVTISGSGDNTAITVSTETINVFIDEGNMILPTLAGVDGYVLAEHPVGKLAWVPQTGGGGSSGQTTADVSIAVSTTGSDATTPNRPALITAGDYTAYPFLTLKAAVASLPSGIKFNLTILVGAGSFAGANMTFNLLDSSKLLRLVGTLGASTLASGAQTGVAGAGSTFTSIKKPTGAPNWTPGDLRGRWVQIVSGGGSPGAAQYLNEKAVTAGVIKDNTIDTITMMGPATSGFRCGVVRWPPINGQVTPPTALDSFTTFAIVEPATIITGTDATANGAVQLLNGSGVMNVEAIDIRAGVAVSTAGFYTTGDLQTLETPFCKFSNASSTVFGILSQAGPGAFTQPYHSYFKNLGYPVNIAQGSSMFAITNVVDGGNYFYCANGETGFARDVDIRGSAQFNLSSLAAVNLIGCSVGGCSVGGASGAAVLCRNIFGVTSLDVAQGTGTNAGYGIDVAGGTYNVPTATATVTGTTGDMSIDGVADTYAELISYAKIQNNLTLVNKV